MLLGGIVANQQNGRRGEDICHAGCSVGLAAKRSRQGSEVRGAVVVHIVRLQDHAGELGEQVSFFIRDARRSDDTDRLTAFLVANFGELLSDQRKCIFPCRRSELAVFADERLRQTFFVIRKIECVTALDAEKIAIRTALVAVVTADDFHAGIGPAHAQRGLATVATVSANRADMFHLPWSRLVAIRSGSQRTDGADVDAHTAFFALEVIFFVRRDDRTHSAVLHPERPHVHAFPANAHATVAKYATRPIEVDHGRPLLFVLMILRLHELRFSGAVREGHVLQFALATRIAYWTIQRMIAE